MLMTIPVWRRSTAPCLSQNHINNTGVKGHRMYNAKVKIYDDDKKFISITFNPEQEQLEQNYFSRYNTSKEISLIGYENECSLAKIISKLIEGIYEDEKKGFSKKFMSWANEKIKSLLTEYMKSDELIIYNKNIYKVGFKCYLKQKEGEN